MPGPKIPGTPRRKEDRAESSRTLCGWWSHTALLSKPIAVRSVPTAQRSAWAGKCNVGTGPRKDQRTREKTFRNRSRARVFWKGKQVATPGCVDFIPAERRAALPGRYDAVWITFTLRRHKS